MHSVSANAAPSRAIGFLLTLANIADEVCSTFARLFAYLGALALIAILGLVCWQQINRVDAGEPANSGWSFADDAVPAFSVRLTEQPDKTATYTVLRHPRGGRKDILRWGEPADRPVAELEIYRLGREHGAAGGAAADLAARMVRATPSELETIGVIDSRFGAVRLLRPANAIDGPGACLGFLKVIKVPALQISGWSCQGTTMPALRAAVGCMLNRLALLPGRQPEPDVAGLFGPIAPKREACNIAPVAGAADWVTTSDDPLLRGAF
jgi:hypothetical protein